MTDEILGVLLEVSVRSLLLVAFVALLLKIARVRAAGIHHAAWTMVMCGMLLMPVLLHVLPPIGLPLPASLTALRGPTREGESRQTPAFPRTSEPGTQNQEPGTGNPVPAFSPAATAGTSENPAGLSQRAWPVGRPMWAVVLYLVGVALFLFRLLFGARLARRLALASRAGPDSEDGVPVLASATVTSPLTVGVFFPAILLPADWHTWPRVKLSAVLAHERAHIERRDPLVLFLARLNCALFWFNPVAWWLERRLATAAEHAADDLAVGKTGNPTEYARVLLELARNVRRRGRRLAWNGIGVDGTGLLGERIERVLASPQAQRMTVFGKTVLGATLLAATALAVACREEAPVAALTPDPEVAAQLAGQQESAAAWARARALPPQEVAALEAQLEKDPENVSIRRQLLTYYVWRGDNKQPWAENVAARRRHALWLIEHHPDSELMELARVSKSADPDGYARSRALWMTATMRPDTTSTILGNAARFFEESEKPVAETLLLRARVADPTGPQPRTKGSTYVPPWASRLGTLYAQVIVGSTGSTLGNVVHETSVAEAHGAYANEVRAKLAQSTDAAVLSAAGSYLVRNASQARLDFDHVALGRSYLQRAMQLDPNASGAQSVLVWSDQLTEHNRLVEAVRAKQIELVGGEVARKARAGQALTKDESNALAQVRYDAVASLSEADRFAYLPELIELDYMRSEWTDPGAPAPLERSKKFLQDLLALAPKFQNDPAYGTVMYRAHVALATHAMRDGDKKAALDHLREATDVPAGEPKRILGLDGRLVNALLDAGERASVAEFLERSADRLAEPERGQRLKDATSIRAGRMPMAYQYAKTRR